MRSRGLGARCPPPVAQKLREAGWKSHAGWWRFSECDRCLRWWDALHLVMGKRKPLSDIPPDPRHRLICDQAVGDLFTAEGFVNAA